MSTSDSIKTASHIEACLADLGTDRFAQAFVAYVETLGVDQIMVFAIDKTQARCLLSWHFSRSALAGKLAETYLDGWFLKDPLLPDLMAAPPQSVTLSRLDEIEGRMSADYRRLFFENPGMLAKTTLLAVGERLRLFVSLYQGDATAPLCDPDLARLAGRLALMHFEKASDTDVPPPLAALSDRERSVCLGILSGRKAEAIAADLDVAPSTVITYRKRAYAKLGVTSRAGLFAICGK
ncbi:helix-turn-helix transcriptional regulator [Roseibium sp. LAB1]